MNISMMTKFALIIAAISLAATAPSFAKTVKLPNDDFAIASIDFPSNWDPEEIDNGVAGGSPDEAVYLAAVAVGSEKGMNAEIEDTFEFLKDHNVELDKASKTENKFKIGNL